MLLIPKSYILYIPEESEIMIVYEAETRGSN